MSDWEHCCKKSNSDSRIASDSCQQILFLCLCRRGWTLTAAGDYKVSLAVVPCHVSLPVLLHCTSLPVHLYHMWIPVQCRHMSLLVHHVHPPVLCLFDFATAVLLKMFDINYVFDLFFFCLIVNYY